MSTLSALGECSYGGVDLNSPEFLTLGLSHIPVQDPSGRTTSYVQTTIRIKTLIHTAVSTTDADFDALVQTLSTQGLAFIYTTKGGGNITANVAGDDAKDVCWGPKPKIIQLTPAGAPRAWNLTWEVVVCLPQCTTASYDDHLMEVNFALTFDEDQSGYTTLNYHGHLRIPGTRVAGDNRRLRHTADEYRARIWPKPRKGFRRSQSSFQLSADKSRLDFVIIDTQMPPNIPPPGIIEVQANHEHTLAGQSGKFLNGPTIGRISASYELRAGQSSDVAFKHFISMSRGRLDIIEKSPQLTIPDYLKKLDKNAPTRAFVMLTGLSTSEPKVYGKVMCNFSLTYLVAGPIGRFLTAGLWEPTPNSDWSAWSVSMPWGEANKPERAIAKIALGPTEDRITDLCDNTTVTSAVSSSGTQSKQKGGKADSQLKNKTPTPSISWIFYRNSLFLEQADGTIPHQPLWTTDPGNPQSVFSGSLLNVAVNSVTDTFTVSGDAAPPQFASSPQTILQLPRSPVYFVIMEGMAIRVGFPITPSTLVRIGLQLCSPANNGPGYGSGQCLAANLFGLPLYVARWRLRYALTGPPELIPVMPHAVLAGGTATGRTSTLKGGGPIF